MSDYQITPTFVTFADLADALFMLHQFEKAHLDSLHDVWRLGAPSPDSHVFNPTQFDERGRQDGNLVKRLILPRKLAQWIQDVSALRGYPYSERQALNIVFGRADYGF